MVLCRHPQLRLLLDLHQMLFELSLVKTIVLHMTAKVDE